ncbi:hypothetical protein Ae201684P_013111 [Aphanomyces euteiches]|uniref:Uncharacterized protein n=1 Tax=Aphanomyces euteiches TaxID=100861 RepID=A0A6G0WK62_9STRA|nr:hypothetical protein Ae201684_014448 [Aphanomyces euteiches]KAH9088898.1 hypothetical protein Ae201684P_013111 [Aphanomyces euteiches]
MGTAKNGRKRDGVKKKKPKKAKATTSIEALVVQKTKLSPAEEAQLFEANKASLRRLRLSRAIYSVISQYHQAYIDWYPYDSKSYERQGYSEFHLENYGKSIERLSQAVYLGANNAKLWRTLGRVCWLQWKKTHEWGLLWDAKSCFENGLRFVEVSTSPFAMFEYAQVLEALGDFAAATGVIKTLLYSFPGFANADQVILRAAILLFHTMIFQKTSGSDHREMLEQCCDYCKFIIDKDVSKTDLYVALLYVTARVHEALAIPRTLKYAAKTYEELYRVALRQGILTPLAGKGALDWFRESASWVVWVEYFERRDELILAVDATQQSLKRVSKREWNVHTFSWEPEATLWRTLGTLFFQCNDMIPAVAAMETSLYFGRYRSDVRETLLQWYPQRWSSPLTSQAKSQVKIAALLRGVWGRDRAKRHKKAVIQEALDQYVKSPYTCRIARRRLAKYFAETYAPLFAAQELSSRVIQKCTHHFLKRLRAYYSHQKHREERIQALVLRLNRDRFDRLVRGELAQLSSEYKKLFAAETSASVMIQRVVRGYFTRVKYIQWREEARTAQALSMKQSTAARMIQRHFRHIRSNAILHTRHLLRRKLERLAVNLQRLYRRNQSLLARFLHAHAKRKQEEAQRRLQRRKCIQIQTWWRRHMHVLDDKPIDEASFLLERLVRGYDALMKDEKDLDFFARRIQALYRGRKDRVNLKGLRRQKMPRPAAIVACLVQEALTARSAALVTESASLVALRGLLEGYQTIVLRPNQPAYLWPNFKAALAQGCGANVQAILVAGGSRIQGDGLGVLVEAMRANQLKRLRVLAIGPNEIGADVAGCMPWRDLSTCLQTAHFQLRELIVEENKLQDTGVMHIANGIGDFFFGRYGHLTRLVLAWVGMTDGACEALGKALAINTVLRVLDLHGNDIRDGGASKLALGFQSSRSLETIDLGDNSVGSTGAKAFFGAVASSSVTSLGLRNNNVQNDALAALTNLHKAKPAAFVELRGNLIHMDNMREIQSWFTPETTEEAAPSSSSPKKKTHASPPTPKKMDVLAQLRQERREMPLKGYKSPASQLVKLPALPSR